jgi:hypothetical protein
LIIIIGVLGLWARLLASSGRSSRWGVGGLSLGTTFLLSGLLLSVGISVAAFLSGRLLSGVGGLVL